MAYSSVTLRAELWSMPQQSLKVNKKYNSVFIWQDKTDTTPADEFSVLCDYCWLVYDKARRAAGPQLVGRTGDLWTGKMLLKYGLVDSSVVEQRAEATKAGAPPRKDLEFKQLNTLGKGGTAGNVQVMDKWAPVINDSWVLGGVHRWAVFELVSPPAPGNLFDVKQGFHVVTARELLGLREFGYEGERLPDGRTIFRCTDNEAAQGATLKAYADVMEKAASLGANSVTGLIGEIMPGLNEEIRSFDRGKLKPVNRPS